MNVQVGDATLKKVVLFVGPTLGSAILPDDGRIEWQVSPPASQGDVYLAARETPWAIALVDGYFERLPSVWHKEILWALSRGVHVLGAASMGALRAAELADCGMVGVGEVFQAYLRGDLEDDDEVALIHGPPESGHMPLSQAMVNIRATLRKAQELGVLGAEAHRRLLRQAKRCFYARRDWRRLRESAAGEGCDRFWTWLDDHGTVDQKHLDLLELVSILSRWARNPPAAPVVTPPPNTVMWRRLHRDALARQAVGNPEEARVVMELRVADPRLYRLYRHWARCRLLALEPGVLGEPPGTDELRPTVQSVRRRFGLAGREAMDRWLREQELTGDRLLDLLSDEHRLGTVDRSPSDRRAIQSGHIAELLRLEGEYGVWRRRAEGKRRIRQSAAAAPTEYPDLWRRYFEDGLGLEVPESLTAYAEDLDFGDRATLSLEAAAEVAYRRARGVSDPNEIA